MTPRRTPSNELPLPTASEAAFERVLAEFDARSGHGEQNVPVAVAASSHAARDEFLERLFRQSKNYLAREPYAGIADATRFHTKIVGVSFEGRQDVLAGLSAGQQLRIERQPENVHDPNAIAVFFGALQLGFLKRELARQLAPAIDAGARYDVAIASLTGGERSDGGDARHRGVNVLVTRRPDVIAGSVARASATREGDRDAVRRALIGESEPHEAQRALLERIEAGRNVLGVLGTGRGKSFCFQFPAACRALEGGAKTLILYPLRALANDQYEGMRRRLDGFGLRILRANGAVGGDERTTLMAALESGEWDIVLSTPEFLQYHRELFTGSGAPALVVVDEAHHAFESKHRAAYTAIGRTIRSLGEPQVLALTATAGDTAFAHVVRELEIDSWVIDPTVRENLHVLDARGTRDKAHYLRELFERSDGKGIVYCNSRSEATSVAEQLRRSLGNVVGFYHAGMPTAERAGVEEFFRGGDLRVVVATSAFGEGIDLPDVRDVVLYHLNFDFTEFNQQSGRAGRDGQPARIHLLFGENDRRLNDFIIDREAPTLPVLREIYKGLKSLSRTGVIQLSNVDISRTLDLDKANERTIAVALRIFDDEALIALENDDEGRAIRLLEVDGKVDLTRNERYAEGEAERAAFSTFCDLVLSAGADALRAIVNRPIYPERVELRR